MAPKRTAAPKLPAPAKPGRPAFLAHVVPGLEDIAASELGRAGAEVTEVVRPRDRRDALILFRTPDIAPVLRCRTLEDVFQVVDDGAEAARARSASAAAAGLERAALDAAMLTHHAVRPKRKARSYKVVARMAGRHAYRREDVERAWARALGRVLPRWAERDPATIELWVHVIEDRVLAGLRLSGDELAQRTYKRAHLPASLKPTVARALVLLSELRAGDVVVDPMCGAGTVLRERADAGRARLIVGGDIDDDAVAAASVNAGRSAALALWDATRLPLRDASVEAMITNPPYGRQHRAVPGLAKLYRLAMREAARVLRPGGRAVVLTGEPQTLLESLPKAIRVRQKVRITLRGLPATAFVIVRE